MDKKTIKIPYLKNDQIEKKSIDLLVDYYKNNKGSIETPIPVFEIVEYLDYHLDFNGEGIFKDDNVLGATYSNDKKIEINEKISKQEGRMNFTIAHEIGHILLHGSLKEHVLCRKDEGIYGDKKETIEVQADKFAAYLIMPTKLVKEAFHTFYEKPVNVAKRKFIEIFFPKSKRYKAMRVASKILGSGNFNNVSKLAMVNRLIGIGLIKGLSFQKNKQ